MITLDVTFDSFERDNPIILSGLDVFSTTFVLQGLGPSYGDDMGKVSFPHASETHHQRLPPVCVCVSCSMLFVVSVGLFLGFLFVVVGFLFVFLLLLMRSWP